MRGLLLAALLLAGAVGRADEGMWMVTNLSARTDSVLAALGLQLTHEELFTPGGASLSRAVVQFGGFCSGVVVSNEGLVFTNHHCGFGCIQAHSSTRHDYLANGFFAKKRQDELPNEGLYVDFHLNTYEVTGAVAAVASIEDPLARSLAVDSVVRELEEAATDPQRGIFAVVTPYYRGSKYYLSVYQRFEDVRLVFAPPQCLGKHGGDTDNWMWPRQTCDFSVFRIYANGQNLPAPYSEDNVPYRPLAYAHVSAQGYQPGDFCMTLGYPGGTDRYLSSYGVENTMRTTNDVRILVRNVKLAILKDAMDSSDELRIMYASKYAQSANYWKFSIGQNKALVDLQVIAEKQALEEELTQWAQAKMSACTDCHLTDSTGHTCRYAQYAALMPLLKDDYEAAFARNYTMNLWTEAFWGGSNILRFILQGVNEVLDEEEDDGRTFTPEKVEKAYKDIDVETDKRLFAAMLRTFAENVPDSDWLPSCIAAIHQAGEDYETVTEHIFAQSVFAHPEQLAEVEADSLLGEDPLMDMALRLYTYCLFTLYAPDSTAEHERLLGDALREMNADKEYYPDANFTMRLSYGQVGGYADYTCFTPSQSIIDKYEQQGDNPDYQLTEPVYRWLKRGKWGKRYTDRTSGDLQLCFLTNNDITGGNSGSGMFDGKGRLVGLAFDGNWEAMSGDLKFDDALQRCIGVDIRYVLSVIEHFGKAKRLINELVIE